MSIDYNQETNVVVTAAEAETPALISSQLTTTDVLDKAPPIEAFVTLAEVPIVPAAKVPASSRLAALTVKLSFLTVTLQPLDVAAVAVEIALAEVTKA